MLFLDADHCIDESSIRYLIEYKIKENEHISFMRGEICAPGVFCVSKKWFIALRGIDEKFSGYYGSEDKNYTLRHRVTGGIFSYVNKFVTVRKRPRHHSLVRDVTRNKKTADVVTHSGLFLNFKWHKVH